VLVFRDATSEGRRRRCLRKTEKIAALPVGLRLSPPRSITAGRSVNTLIYLASVAIAAFPRSAIGELNLAARS